jgi:hypothetical protein
MKVLDGLLVAGGMFSRMRLLPVWENAAFWRARRCDFGRRFTGGQIWRLDLTAMAFGLHLMPGIGALLGTCLHGQIRCS